MDRFILYFWLLFYSSFLAKFFSHFWRNFASQNNRTRLDGQTQDEGDAVGGALASHSHFGAKKL
jgi:hypothetical protein